MRQATATKSDLPVFCFSQKSVGVLRRSKLSGARDVYGGQYTEIGLSAADLRQRAFARVPHFSGGEVHSLYYKNTQNHKNFACGAK